MRIVSMCHEIPPKEKRLPWMRRESGDYEARVEAPWGPLLVSVYGRFSGSIDYGSVWGRVMVSAGGEAYCVGTVDRSEHEVRRRWALGRPALIADEGDDVRDLTLHLAEVLLPTIRPVPRLSGSVLGFRGYTSPSIGQKTPWWEWDATRTPRCRQYCSRSPGRDCMCGFHASANAWSAATYALSERNVLVVAPFGRVIEHEEGMRCEHYDVLAAVYPLDAPAPDDPRVIRARNVPLRAWEVAQELLAASHVEEVLAWVEGCPGGGAGDSGHKTRRRGDRL